MLAFMVSQRHYANILCWTRRRGSPSDRGALACEKVVDNKTEGKEYSHPVKFIL